jgi:hypothetical protein
MGTKRFEPLRSSDFFTKGNEPNEGGPGSSDSRKIQNFAAETRTGAENRVKKMEAEKFGPQMNRGLKV